MHNSCCGGYLRCLRLLRKNKLEISLAQKVFFSEQLPQNPTLEVEAKGDVPKTNKRTVT